MRKQGRRDLGSDSDMGAGGLTACGPFPTEALCPSPQRQLDMLSPCSPSWVSPFSRCYGVGQPAICPMRPFYKRTLGVLLCLPSLPVTGPPEDNFLIPFGPVANLTATQVTGRTNLPPTLLTTDTLSPVQSCRDTVRSHLKP